MEKTRQPPQRGFQSHLAFNQLSRYHVSEFGVKKPCEILTVGSAIARLALRYKGTKSCGIKKDGGRLNMIVFDGEYLSNLRVTQLTGG